MDRDEIEAKSFLLAHELIEEHGDNVASFLQLKLDELMASGKILEFTAWFVIRNAVGITLRKETKLIQDNGSYQVRGCN